MLKKKRTDQSLTEELRRSNQQLTTLKKEHTELEFQYNRTRCREQELQEKLSEERIEKIELEKKMALIVGMRGENDVKVKENELLKHQMDRTPRPASARLGSPPPPPPPRSNPSSPTLRGSMRIPPPPPPPLSMSSSSSPLLSPTTPHPPSPPPSPVTPTSTRSVPVPSRSAPVAPVRKCPIDPAYKRYFKLKKLNMPIENLKQKIKNDGYDPDVIDQDEPEWDPEPDESIASAPPITVPPVTIPAPVRKCPIDPAYKRYFKLKKLNMPIENLKQKIKNDGYDPDVIDQDEPEWDPEPDESNTPAPVPVPPAVPSVVPVRKCPIDPVYKRYFKLKKLNMPIENLKQKIKNDGYDPDVIDQDEPEWDPEPDESISTPAAPPVPLKPQPPSIPEPEPEPEDPYTPPVREKNTPSVPLRQLYWSTVTGRALKDTVWESMAEKRQTLDTHEIEELFEVKKQQTTSPSHSVPVIMEEETVSFVDGKRETNIGIGLRKLRYSGEEVKRFLLKIDTFSLSTEALTVMAEIMPKEEECSVIRGYQGDVEKLSFVNAFLYSVAEIPNCADRVKCLLIRSTFDEEKERIKEALNDFKSDCSVVLENQHFLYLLDYILEIGNYLNGTTARGGACGYHLDILPQLERTKTSDNCMTLVEYD